jgi:hypothetical protein
MSRLKENLSSDEALHDKNNLIIWQTANQRIERAKKQPIPQKLFGTLWYESEICFLFSDTNVGKTILALQIANSITSGKAIKGFEMNALTQMVIVFDFEMNDKQFEKRCSNNYKDHYCFDDKLKLATINNDFIDYDDSDKQMHNAIEKAIVGSKSKIVVIDNITYLNKDTSKGDRALELMKLLKRMKSQHQLSILVLAHCVKRDKSRPLVKDNMAGSSNLQNFADSMFALGRGDDNTRYIKQLKSRFDSIYFGGENVIVLHIEEIDNLLQMTFDKYDDESNYLTKISIEDKEQLADEIRVYKKKYPNKSIREIEKDLGVSKSRVHRALKE